VAALEQILIQVSAETGQADDRLKSVAERAEALGRALDNTTDPINALRNGLEGLGDRLVVFGDAGATLRNEIEAIRDPVLRAKVANEQWAAASTNLSGVIGGLSDRLQVARIRAAGAVGGIENLDRITLAAAAGVGLLAAGMVKLGSALLDVASKGLAVYSASLEDATRRTQTAEAQTQSLYQTIGRGLEVFAGADSSARGYQYQLGVLEERLDAVNESAEALQAGPLTRSAARTLELRAATLLGVGGLALFRQSSADVADEQVRLEEEIQGAREVMQAQARDARALSEAFRGLGRDVAGAYDQIAQRVAGRQREGIAAAGGIRAAPGGGGGGGRAPRGLLEQVLGVDYVAQIEETERERDQLRGLAASLTGTGPGRQGAAAALQGLGGAATGGAGEAGAAEADARAAQIERTTALLRQQAEATRGLQRGFVGLGQAAAQGLGALGVGATTAGGAIGALGGALGQLSTDTGSYLLAAGLGFSALPLGFSAAGAVAAGVTLLALGSALSAASARVGAPSGGSGASSSAASTPLSPSGGGALGLVGSQAPPRETRIALYLGAVEVGEVVVGAVQDAQRRGALQLDRR
jgi:hypothetical protein